MHTYAMVGHNSNPIPLVSTVVFRTDSWLAHCRVSTMVCQRKTMENGAMHEIWIRMVWICPLSNQGNFFFKKKNNSQVFLKKTLSLQTPENFSAL